MIEINDYETITNEIAALINNDPTAAKRKYKSAMDLATCVYAPNLDAISLQKIVDAVANVLKETGRNFFPFTVTEFRNSVKTLSKENNKKLSHEDLVKQQLGEYPAHCGEFVELWVSRFASDITWNYNGTITRNGQCISVDSIITEMRNCENALKLKYGKDLLVSNMKIYMGQTKYKRLDYFKTMLMPSGDTEILKQFRDACEGFFMLPETAYNAILEFIRQVKRELYGLPIKYHHFLYIHSSDQGTGKSEFVRLLKKPLHDLTNVCRLEQLFDPAYVSFPEYYILDFDDVSRRLAEFEVSRLKEMITAKEIPGRYFHSNTIERIPRKFHGIATSNKPLLSVISDNQMRRFIDLQVKPLPKKKNVYEEGCVNQKEWDAIESVSYDRLWNAVDHKADAFLSKHNDEVSISINDPKAVNVLMARWS